MTVPIMERRRIATQATMARFIGTPFEWGTADCAKMVAFHLRQLGIRIGISKAGKYSTALSARAALKRMGVTSLEAIADKYFDRIPPAATVAGDILIGPGEDAFGALYIATGNGTMMGWHEDHEGAVIIRASYIDTLAWRVL